MLARVAHLSSHQIAERIVATDIAVLIDSVGYFHRRVSWTGKPSGNPSDVSNPCVGEARGN